MRRHYLLRYRSGGRRQCRNHHESSYEDTQTTPDFSGEDEPFALFAAWMKDAEAKEPNDPNAMALATVDQTGPAECPDGAAQRVRAGQLRVLHQSGKRQGRGIALGRQGGALLPWKSLSAQVRVRGTVAEVGAEEADDYFATRARGSRLGAWASQQSRPLESRFALEKAVARYAAQISSSARSPPASLVGLPAHPGRDRILA